MENRRKRKSKLNNTGMTLVEILIAMAILSVAIIPLMYSFVNSARYNGRGRELQQTTVLAHSIIENCKAYSQEEIEEQMLTDGTFLTGVTAAQAEKVGDTYYMEDVPLENQKYDVSLQFVPRGVNESATTTFDILKSSTMNPYLDAVFTPEGASITLPTLGTYTAAELDDLAFLTAFEDIAKGIRQKSTAILGPGKGIDLPINYIEDSFKTGGSNAGRFSISKDTQIYIMDAGGQDVVSVSIYYTYKLTGDTYNYVYAAGTADEQIISWSYDASASENVFGPYTFKIYETNDETKAKGAKIENVYFFYYPVYDNAASFYPFKEDKISVNNHLTNSPRTVDVHLIKQKNPAYLGSETTLSMMDRNYYPTVAGSATYGAPGINLYHNYNMDVTDNSIVPGDKTSTFAGFTAMDSMVQTVPKALIYDVVVNIYRAGSYDPAMDSLVAGSTPILTMDGTDLDW